MQFESKQRHPHNKNRYEKEYMDVAYDFTKRIYKEFGDFLKGVVLFGAAARKTYKTKGDIDILVIIDDATTYLSPEMIQAYRVIIQKHVAKTSKKLHITTLKFTTFWEYVRMGDPIAVNILRDGVALIDIGFFEPLQILLFQGRIRPTPESVWNYFARAPQTLHNARWHIMQGTIDLYWAVIDSAHSALMKIGKIPPSPEHVSEMLDEELASKGLINKRCPELMKNFYNLSKQITHKDLRKISGEEFERYFKDADFFVKEMKKFIEK